MSKEALVLLLLVGGVAIGIIFAVRHASSNEADWAAYEQTRLGESYRTVRERFRAAGDDLNTISDARSIGYGSEFKESLESGATRIFVVPTQADSFIFGFDKNDKLVYKSFRKT